MSIYIFLAFPHDFPSTTLSLPIRQIEQKKKTLLVFLITVHMDVHQPGHLS